MSKKITKKTKTIKKTISTLSRPPVVAVLGHVDHGKTTLLDAIRKSSVAKGEFGGITQHIGAYQVEVDTREGKRKITFIDTPGHEAFSQMRSRGAAITDLVILVIDATKGVQPQTEESIEHIKKAKVPFIVAATKMDLPGANIERVKKHLSKIGILTEDYGGEIVVVPVSSVTNTGINQLLEMILLIAEMNGLKGDRNDPFLGVVIESELDRKKGPVGTVLVKQGTVKVGEDIFLGEKKERIRAMFDEYGRNLTEAGPARPVEILGFTFPPPVGGIVTKEKTSLKPFEIKRSTEADPNLKQLTIILKTDAIGSLEAILGKLNKNIHVLEGGIGDIGESEIMRAQTSHAFVIGFQVKVSKSAKKLAEEDKVMLKTYTIIYDLLDELHDAADLLGEGIKEEILGRAKVLAIFSTSEGKIAGLSVISGKLVNGDKVKLMRNEIEIGTGKILNLKQAKNDVPKIDQGEEGGAKLSTNLDFIVGDMLISVKLPEIIL